MTKGKKLLALNKEYQNLAEEKEKRKEIFNYLKERLKWYDKEMDRLKKEIANLSK